VTRHHAALVLSGAVAVAIIALATVMMHRAIVAPPLFGAMLLGTYALGLGLGRLALGRGS
jgi:hypothetical protein